MNELDKIKETKEKLLALVGRDNQEEAINLISDMLSAQAQSDVESVELVVPTKSVNKRIDLGAVEFLDTTAGILFNAKGFSSTLIRPSADPLSGATTGVYGILSTLLPHMENDFKDIEDEDAREFCRSMAQAYTIILQAPMFCCVKNEFAYETAAMLLNNFNNYVEEFVKNATPKDETTEDAVKNAAMTEQLSQQENV